eukprot:TRINITY_DN2478_c0_g1_i1.p2 TRINITY_DN2478_c0_g1~~TRINITY_DN2478_c0_g1_i1.p2  ORF type:complete len:232 (+),score=-9.09 TRINITY_DN2478_c0_g1_i1:392-1087(+)
MYNQFESIEMINLIIKKLDMYFSSFYFFPNFRCIIVYAQLARPGFFREYQKQQQLLSFLSFMKQVQSVLLLFQEKKIKQKYICIQHAYDLVIDRLLDGGRVSVFFYSTRTKTLATVSFHVIHVIVYKIIYTFLQYEVIQFILYCINIIHQYQQCIQRGIQYQLFYYNGQLNVFFQQPKVIKKLRKNYCIFYKSNQQNDLTIKQQLFKNIIYSKNCITLGYQRNIIYYLIYL